MDNFIRRMHRDGIPPPVEKEEEPPKGEFSSIKVTLNA